MGIYTVRTIDAILPTTASIKIPQQESLDAQDILVQRTRNWMARTGNTQSVSAFRAPWT